MDVLNKSRSDRLFDWFNVLLFCGILFVVIYPLYFIIVASISSPDLVNSGQIRFLPRDVTWIGYERIFNDDEIWRGYSNSIFYTFFGTLFRVSLIITGGYALSRKDLPFSGVLMILILFTMFFNGGLIPTYLLVKELGMVNTIWAMIVPGAVSVYQLIIVRTFFQNTIPGEMLEAAMMDGCGNFKFFIRMVIPLSLPIIAVMVLFNAVALWNSYFQALIYLNDASLHPLQIVLRKILIVSEAQLDMIDSSKDAVEEQKVAGLVKYGMVVVASLPVLVLYPFLQRYFVKGVMIGSVKG
ncbi:carbohydrate ABC transporter permease [Paenibacillus sp. F411]|uniref:Sugar ABC transporter permease n=1 Tax=Paenibacillus algicola TaxID=2565926 RepID=A0A4P8XLB2_9BACL|nr:MULTISPECIES: carbohydrate ABC transporter permease [Paenibacillus]MBO2945492.1 carbohydrate ABC transporter permease [Paenibacillus sp. F411]QCT00959.1 sugar ABC transporter permease [Paenibacillus algicola]